MKLELIVTMRVRDATKQIDVVLVIPALASDRPDGLDLFCGAGERRGVWKASVAFSACW